MTSPLRDRAARLLFAAAALACLGMTAAHAQSGGVAARGVAVQLSSGAVFNWLQPKPHKAGVSKAVLVSSDGSAFSQTGYFGKGSYICSPAGFGMKSRCFAR